MVYTPLAFTSMVYQPLGCARPTAAIAVRRVAALFDVHVRDAAIRRAVIHFVHVAVRDAGTAFIEMLRFDCSGDRMRLVFIWTWLRFLRVVGICIGPARNCIGGKRQKAGQFICGHHVWTPICLQCREGLTGIVRNSHSQCALRTL